MKNSDRLRYPILMIPGPTELSDDVRRRCGGEVPPHYDAQTGFPEFYLRLTEKMKPIFGLVDGDVIIANGSGSVAVNMMLASVCTGDDEVLILDNGAFGAYAAKNCRALGIPFSTVKGAWGTAIDPDRVRDAMRTKRRPFIYMTHNESSTAVVNPIPPVGAIAREFDALLLSDSVSALGGISIDMGESGADIVAGASQKCLELPPGLAPVGVSSRAWEYMEKMKNRRVPWILDLVTWKRASIDQRIHHPQPVTGATTLLLALDWMVDRILEEGIPNRESRFQLAGKQLMSGMDVLGFYMTAAPGNASPVVTDLMVPDGMNGEIVRRYYFERHNTMVGYGFYDRDEQKKYSRSFRIAHFGRSADHDRIEHMIEITKHFLKECC